MKKLDNIKINLGNTNVKVSCVIPCYNEKDRISNVLKVCEAAEWIREIVVVDNASPDGTADFVRNIMDPAKTRIIAHKENMGKAFSVKEGFHATTGALVLFIDADLEGLTQKHLKNLCDPVLKNTCDCTLSDRTNFYEIGFNAWFLTGDRCFKRDVWEEFFSGDVGAGYLIEPSMNNYAISNKLRVGVVDWRDVHGPIKAEKMGLFDGMSKETQMFRTIMKFTGVIGFFRMWWVLTRMARYFGYNKSLSEDFTSRIRMITRFRITKF